MRHTFLVAAVGLNMLGFDFLCAHKLVLLHDPVRLELYVPQPERCFNLDYVVNSVGLSTRRAPLLLDRMCNVVDSAIIKEAYG